jgi:flagellar protein FlaF
MAAGELIGAAIGALILVIIAYVLVGSVLSTAVTVANAQKDLTLQDEARLGTRISITSKEIQGDNISFSVSNNGTEVINDFTHMDILSSNSSYDLQYYLYDPTRSGAPGTWSVNGFDPVTSSYAGELDPGQTMSCNATYTGNPPTWFQITTGNGVYASAFI